MSVNDMEVTQADFVMNLLQEQATGMNLTGRYPIAGYGRAGESTLSDGDVITAEYLNGLASGISALEDKFALIPVEKESSTVLDVNGPLFGVLFTSGGASAQRGGVYTLQRASADSTAYVTQVHAATNATLSVSDGVLTIANANTSNIMKIYVLLFAGSLTEHVEPEASNESR